MSREKVDLIRDAYKEGYETRSVEGMRDRVAPGFRFHMRPGFPGRPVYLFDEMPQIRADLDDTFTEYELVPEDFISLGDYVLVTIRQSARVRESDTRIETTVWHLWHIEAGKVLEACTFDDREEALRVVGASGG
jgi:hypothetical protein